MVSAEDYFSIPESSSPSKQNKEARKAMKKSMKEAKNSKRMEIDADEAFYSGSQPPRHKGFKQSYRTSYPQSKREMQEYIISSTQAPPGPSAAAPPDGFNRRSSLRRPGLRRRNSSPPKRVRFSEAAVIYEPFNPEDWETIDQIMNYLSPSEMPSPSSIPQASPYPVVLRPMDAVRDYPKLVSTHHERTAISNALRAELVDGGHQIAEDRYVEYPTLPRLERDHRPEKKATEVRQYLLEEQHERDFRSALQSPFPQPLPSVNREGSWSPRLAREPRKRYSGSHYETHSQRQETARSKSSTRPRGNSDPSPRSGATSRSNRSSLDSDKTCTNPESTWVPAKVALKKANAREIDVNEPVVHASDDGTTLHRSDAQRLPPVPRRNKLLESIARIWA